MELTQNLWERYGFTHNPYDTKALSLSKAAPLSVQEAYIPRADSAATADLLTNFLRNPGGGRIVVEGDPGVGKTTFVNFHRQQWETKARHKLGLNLVSQKERVGRNQFYEIDPRFAILREQQEHPQMSSELTETSSNPTSGTNP